MIPATGLVVLLAVAATASPSPSSSCARDVVPISAVQPDYPDSERRNAPADYSVTVRVSVDATGKVTDVQIADSSGNAAIDASAIRAARESTYESKVVDCKAVPGSYLFHADFRAVLNGK